MAVTFCTISLWQWFSVYVAACFVSLIAPGIPFQATVALMFLLGASVSVPYYICCQNPLENSV